MNILLTIPRMVCGGAERVLSVLANEWSVQGHSVLLVSLDDTPSFFALEPGVKHLRLDVEHATENLVQAFTHLCSSVFRLRKAMRVFRPDFAVAFTTRANVKTLLAAKGLGFPVLVSERSDPASYREPKLWRFLRKWQYPKARALVVQTETVSRYYRDKGATNVVIIPNPVQKLTSVSKDEGKPFVFLCVGRFFPVKGQDLLLRAFSKIPFDPDVELHLVGDGPESANLANLAVELKVDDRTRFWGAASNPGPYLARADVFVLPSRIEGFPNSLCEAMISGVASVSFDCPSGPRAIIQDGVNGLLVPPEDVEALGAAMTRLMKDRRLRKELAEEGKKLESRLSIQAVSKRWLSLAPRAGTA